MAPDTALRGGARRRCHTPRRRAGEDRRSETHGAGTEGRGHAMRRRRAAGIPVDEDVVRRTH